MRLHWEDMCLHIAARLEERRQSFAFCTPLCCRQSLPGTNWWHRGQHCPKICGLGWAAPTKHSRLSGSAAHGSVGHGRQLAQAGDTRHDTRIAVG